MSKHRPYGLSRLLRSGKSLKGPILVGAILASNCAGTIARAQLVSPSDWQSTTDPFVAAITSTEALVQQCVGHFFDQHPNWQPANSRMELLWDRCGNAYKVAAELLRMAGTDPRQTLVPIVLAEAQTHNETEVIRILVPGANN